MDYKSFEEARKTTALRHLLRTNDLSFFMEAHSPLSAKVAEEVGFECLWASGFSIATSLGLRDANELTFSQILDVLEGMADSSSTPILVDGDTGWGNFNNLRRAVVKLCERGLAGICIEDKLFPKMNSFVGSGQPLAQINEFCGKIRAANDSKPDPDFVVVARVEALVSGLPLEEALMRADAYADAGADAILIHSKKKDASEIIAFAEAFNRRCPLLIVPTTYFDTDINVFRASGISGVIWANHSMRASVRGMRDACRVIRELGSVASIERELPPISEIFQMFDYAELEAAERLYLP